MHVGAGRYAVDSSAPVVYSNLVPYRGQMLEGEAAAPAGAPPAGPPAIPVVAVADNYAQALAPPPLCGNEIACT